MTDVDRLTEIRKRLDAATPGPWRNAYPLMRCDILHDGKEHNHGGYNCVYKLRGWTPEDVRGETFAHDIYCDRAPIGSTLSPVMIVGNYDEENGGVLRSEDAAFITHSRDDVEWLLAEIERLSS